MRTHIIATALAAATLASPAASAHDGWRGGCRGGYGYGWHGPRYYGPGPGVVAGTLLGLGATAAILGGDFYAPRVYCPPPVVYAPPPMLYAPPPMLYAPPPVYYAPAPDYAQPGW